MSDFAKLLLVFAMLGERVRYCESYIVAGGREYHYDVNGVIIDVKEAGR